MPKPRPTANGKLSDLARHVVVPDGLVSTGWPAVRDKSLELGIHFDPWQDGVGRIILSKRADGSYATSVGGVVISIPRQVGKTFLIGAMVFALCLLFPGLTVIWTSHRLRTAGETFSSMQGMTRRRKIAPHIEKVVLGSGEEEILFRNGSRILFGARERGFGRGFTLVDVLVFDEAQILTENAIDDMVPATNQSPNPLLLFMGTPPKPTDPGEVFTAKRDKALAGTSADMAYIEFGADPDADPDDRKQWAKANASYPRRTPAQSIMRMRENLTLESFMREALGIWPERSTGGAFDLEQWLSAADSKAERGKSNVFGVDVGEDRVAYVAVAWRRPDRSVQVMLTDEGGLSPLGTAPRLAELARRWKGPVMLGGPSTSLEGDVRGSKIVTAGEFAAACGHFDDLLRDGRIHHGNQEALNLAVQAAKWRSVGTAGERAIQLKDAPLVGPLAAVLRALHGLMVAPAKPPAPPLSAAGAGRQQSGSATGDLTSIEF